MSIPPSDPVCIESVVGLSECDPNGITLPSKGSIHELGMTLIREAHETQHRVQAISHPFTRQPQKEREIERHRGMWEG